MIRNPIPWPNGARCAVAITFRHGCRQPDPYRAAGGRIRPSLPRLHGTLRADGRGPPHPRDIRRLGIRQSFFIPGWCLETYPDAVEAILSDGHEIGHHGWIHEDPVTTRGPSQAEAFEKALDAHRRICGGLPRGYRAPVYNVTQQVIDLMIRHGLRYDSSLMADDIPYRIDDRRGRALGDAGALGQRRLAALRTLCRDRLHDAGAGALRRAGRLLGGV